jgi:hypothetical protein
MLLCHILCVGPTQPIASFPYKCVIINQQFLSSVEGIFEQQRDKNIWIHLELNQISGMIQLKLIIGEKIIKLCVHTWRPTGRYTCREKQVNVCDFCLAPSLPLFGLQRNLNFIIPLSLHFMV